MALSTGIALGVFPLYWLGAREQGVMGLAAASATAITMNAILTLVWLNVRAGSPNPLALLRTLVRGGLVVAVAGVGTTLALAGLREALPWAIAQGAVGAGLYLFLALVGIRLFGDDTLRAGIDALFSRLRRTAGTSAP